MIVYYIIILNGKTSQKLEKCVGAVLIVMFFYLKLPQLYYGQSTISHE